MKLELVVLYRKQAEMLQVETYHNSDYKPQKWKQ